MHMSGRARTWKQSYFINRQGVSWNEFTVAICRRFSQMGKSYLVREFSNFRQVGTVERYQEGFEDLRTQLLCYNPQLTEEHFIACYIGGLKEELVPFMDIAHPNSLEEAYEQAKLHEKAMATINKRLKGSSRSTPYYQPSSDQKVAVGVPSNNPQHKGPSYAYSNNRALIEQRRAAVQCFKCG